MLTSLVLPLFGLLSLYYTFSTLVHYIHNPFLLLLCTVLTISLQVAFVDIILPYNSQFNTKSLFFSNTSILYGNPIILTEICNIECFLLICLIYRKKTKPISHTRCNTFFYITSSFRTQTHFHLKQNLI